MNHSLQHAVAMGVVTVSLVGLAGCGSDDDSPTAPAAATEDDPAADEVVDNINEPVSPADSVNIVYEDLKASIAEFRSGVEELPPDTEALLDQLKTDIDDAENATAEQAAAGYAIVKIDIDAIHDQITTSEAVGVDAKAGWEKVKGEFDGIDAGF